MDDKATNENPPTAVKRPYHHHKDIKRADVVEKRHDVNDHTQNHNLNCTDEKPFPIRYEEAGAGRTYSSQRTQARTVLFEQFSDACNEHGHGQQTGDCDKEVNNGGKRILLWQVLHDDLLDAARIVAEVDGGDGR